MIYVTRLNHTPVVLNCDLIEHIETTPDTVISLTTGQKMMVLETPDEVVDRILAPENLEHTPARPGNDTSISAGHDIHGRR